jgi:hypothetical protein
MRSTGGRAKRLLAAGLVIALLTSCTSSLRSVRVDALPVGLREGDHVWVTRKDGTAVTFTVEAVTDDALSGSGGEIVRLSDIDRIEVVTVAPSKAAMQALMVTFYLAAVAGFAFLLFWGAERGVVELE